MQHIHKGRFVDDTTFVDKFGNEYNLQVSNFGGDNNDSGDSESDNSDKNNQDNSQNNNRNNKQSDNNSQSNSNDKESQGDNQDDNQNGDGDSSQDNDDDLIEPEVGALFDDVMTGKQYRWNGNEFEEV
jgi:conserved plasmodium protein|nr:MAG TPA: hypothetical protein [Caudoviricetes sp.]